MSCIWSGHLQNILHAVQLQSIVDRLMFWALKFFKPWVTECLEHWYEQENKYELIYPTKSKSLTFELLIGSIRNHKSTQTMGDEQLSPDPRGRSQFSENQSETHFSSCPDSYSDITDSDQIDPYSNPASNRSSLSTSEFERLPRSQSQPASDRYSLSHSSGLSEVDPESSHLPTMPVRENTDHSTSEVEVRLLEIRARVRKACIGSLILTNRVHALSQKITLAQMRSQAS